MNILMGTTIISAENDEAMYPENSKSNHQKIRSALMAQKVPDKSSLHSRLPLGIIINEWMMHLYSALLCIAVHPKRFTIIWGGLSSTTTSVQHPFGWCDGSHSTTAPVRSPHTGGEEGEWWSQSSGWGLLGGHDWQGPVGGNLARTPGLHPYSLQWVSWDF